jgi:hypothetical protein
MNAWASWIRVSCVSMSGPSDRVVGVHGGGVSDKAIMEKKKKKDKRPTKEKKRNMKKKKDLTSGSWSHACT